MGTGFVTGADGIGLTACGRLKVFAKKVVINVRAKRSLHCRWGLGFEMEKQRDFPEGCGPRRKAGLK